MSRFADVANRDAREFEGALAERTRVLDAEVKALRAELERLAAELNFAIDAYTALRACVVKEKVGRLSERIDGEGDR